MRKWGGMNAVEQGALKGKWMPDERLIASWLSSSDRREKDDVKPTEEDHGNINQYT